MTASAIGSWCRSGRSLDGSEPKYLNSPETEVFEKGKHLFGLDKASNAIRKEWWWRAISM